MPLYAHVPAQLPRTVPCPIAFVGEAPGDSEVVKGNPLCGPGGRLFDKMLKLADIWREDCWVGNVFDEKMPKNDIRGWCQKERPEHEEPIKFPGAGYLRPEYYWHFERLRGELEAAQPAVIVPMGGAALWAFVGHTKITAARGAIGRATQIVPGAKILPTFHPMYVQHSYKALTVVVGDMRKAMRETLLAADEMVLTPRELWLEPTLEDLEVFWDAYISSAALLALDIETAAGQITHFGVGTDAHHALSLPFVDFSKPSRSYWDAEQELAAWKWVRRVCAHHAPKLFQNGPYDVFWLLRERIKVRNWREDTRLLHHALYPELKKDLGFMASLYAQEGAWKALAHLVKSDEKRDA